MPDSEQWMGKKSIFLPCPLRWLMCFHFILPLCHVRFYGSLLGWLLRTLNLHCVSLIVKFCFVCQPPKLIFDYSLFMEKKIKLMWLLSYEYYLAISETIYLIIYWAILYIINILENNKLMIFRNNTIFWYLTSSYTFFCILHFSLTCQSIILCVR